MKTLLKIQASLFGANGQSSQLADDFVARWLASNPDGRVVTRDLTAEPVPHLSAERFGVFLAKPQDRTPAQQTIVDYSDRLIGELQNADVVVFAMPMYNFSVPSTVRSYFDHIARAGVTFQYTERGAEGLIKGKQVYLFVARGGIYTEQADTETPYLRQFLGFLGMTDVKVIDAQGLAMGDESRERGLSIARQAIAELIPITSAAA